MPALYFFAEALGAFRPVAWGVRYGFTGGGPTGAFEWRFRQSLAMIFLHGLSADGVNVGIDRSVFFVLIARRKDRLHIFLNRRILAAAIFFLPFGGRTDLLFFKCF